MQTKVSFGWKHAIALLAIAAVASVAFASVFVYYPGTVTAYYQNPPIKWEGDSNSNETDLEGQTIEVTVGHNSTNLNVKVHPTYEYTYYKGIVKISNVGTGQYNVYIRVVQHADFGSISGGEVKLILHMPNNGDQVLDMTVSDGMTYGPFLLGSGESIGVDLQYFLPDGVKLPSSINFIVQLIYTPGSETPPSTV